LRSTGFVAPACTRKNFDIMALPCWGFAGFCMLIVGAQNLKEAALTTPEGACLKGSKCLQKETSPLGLVQMGSKGGKSNMMEKPEYEVEEAAPEEREEKKIEDEFLEASAEKKEKPKLLAMLEDSPVPPLEDKCVGDCAFCKPHDEKDSNVFNDMPLCSNGEYQWDCVSGGRGHRVQCPSVAPIMCAYKKCDGGKDYCCEKDCGSAGSEPFGGPRLCEATLPRSTGFH